MANDAPPALPDVNTWLPLQLQLIVFPEDPSLRDQDWLLELTHMDDVQSTRNRRERLDVVEMEGQGRSLQLQMDQLRYIWTALPHIDPQGESLEQVPSVGEYEAARQWFDGLMETWLVNSCPPVQRIALLGRFFQPAGSRENAYNNLDRYLHFVEVHADSFDLEYKLNRKRPTTTGIGDLYINRLAKWSVMHFQLSIEAQTGEGASRALRRLNEDGVFVDIDINSDKGFSLLPLQERLPDLLHEFSGLTTEILASGDVR